MDGRSGTAEERPPGTGLGRLERALRALETEEACLEAVGRNGMALAWIPEKLKTPAVCRAAIEDDGWALACVPEGLKTPEICAEAVRTADLRAAADESVLKYAPEGMMERTLEILREREEAASAPRP